MTVPQALNAALASHQAGDYARAEQLYRQVLNVDRLNTDALHLLGLVLFQTGRADDAQTYLREALRLRPDFTQAYYNLGNILRETSRPADAVQAYQRAVQLQPTYAEAWYNLGNSWHDLKNYAAAAEAHRQAVKHKPNYTKALNNLGNAYLDLRQPDEAADCYRQILEQNPGYAKGYCNLGHALRDLGKLDESIANCRRSIELDPANPEAYNNLGAAQMDRGDLPAAIESFGEAIRMRPDYAEARMNRAMTWLLAGDFEQGWPEYEWRWRSKVFTPRGFAQPLWDGSPLAGRTILLHAEQGLGDTLHFVRYVPLVAQRGGRVIVECSAALHNLLADFPGIDLLVAAGQPLPDFDLHAPFLSLPGLLYDASTWRAASLPLPLGEATGQVRSKALQCLEQHQGTEVPYYEQATGQSSPHAPREDSLPHAEREGYVTGRVGPASRAGLNPARLAGTTTTGRHPVQGEIPFAGAPYLFPRPDLQEQWRTELSQRGGFKVGINWQGNPQHPKDKQRSMPLSQFLPLAEIPGVRLISLQKNFGSEQLPALPEAASIEDLGARLDETSGAFMDTAAVLVNLDLVITSDTALAHLAGALGVPVWVALSTTPDWRWLLERATTPWYPSMRLFRQREPGNWEEVFTQIGQELALQRTM